MLGRWLEPSGAEDAVNEAAKLLANAENPVILVDRFARTFDGMALAFAICRHLLDKNRALTLFATHYHELTELAGRLVRVKNFNVAVREWNDQIIFLRKIVVGGTDKSYGIHVARLAGVPSRSTRSARIG